MILADWELQGYEVKHILDTIHLVPAEALGVALLGALIGWVAAGLVDGMPAGIGIFAGIVLAVSATGFNVPQLGIQHPLKPCNQLLEKCLPTFTTSTSGSSP